MDYLALKNINSLFQNVPLLKKKFNQTSPLLKLTKISHNKASFLTFPLVNANLIFLKFCIISIKAIKHTAQINIKFQTVLKKDIETISNKKIHDDMQLGKTLNKKPLTVWPVKQGRFFSGTL